MESEAKKELVVDARVNKLHGNFVIEKAKPLAIMQNMPFSLGEFKVLDTYLSRINARDDSHRTVKFSIEEYEKLMGIDRMRPERMEKYIDSMMQKLVTIEDPENPKAWRKFVLFGASRCYQDKNKQWWVELTCTEDAKELFFALENVGYFRYYLSSVTSLKSLQAYYLYLYFIRNGFRNSWKEEIPALRDYLCCTSETYNDFRYFKRDVLEKALKEVNAKTDVKYEISTVKNGKRVIAVQFTKIRSDLLDIKNPEPLDAPLEQYKTGADLGYEAEEKYEHESVQFIGPACKNEFSEEELLLALSILRDIMPKPQYYDTERYDYLAKKYIELNLRDAKLKEKGESINNRFAYFKTMLEADLEQ